MNTMTATAVALAATLTMGSSLAAETIRATSGFGADHSLATAIYPEIGAKLDEFTQGGWSVEDTPSGMVAPNEMVAGLRDGKTDLGAVVLPYFPELYADSSLPSELSLIGSDSRAISAATTEYLVTCDACRAEFASNGQVYLGSDTTPSYNLLTTQPVRNAEDLRGMRIRVGAPIFAAFITKLGGVVVQAPSSELADALSRNAVAGTFDGDQEIIGGGVRDQIKFVTDIGLGVYNGAAAAVASQSLWDRMSPEDRAALARAAQYGIAKGVDTFRTQADEARKVEGIEFIEMDDSLQSARDAFIGEQLTNAARILADRGVTDAQAKAYRYAALIGKWEHLITPEMTPEDLAQLRYDEIFADLDMAAFPR